MTTTDTNTTAASIEDTIRTTLEQAGYGSYMRQAAPVVTALVEREKALASTLVDYAVDQGDADEDEIKSYLREVGMTLADDPAPEAEESTEEPAGAGDPSIAAALQEIKSTLDGLTSFARANGYRG